MPRSLLLLLTLAFWLLTPLPAPGQGDPVIDLRPRWKEGQTSRYQFWTRRKQQVSLSVGGKSRQTQQTMTSRGRIDWKVTRARPDGSYRCTMTFDWITSKISGPDGSQNNDSRKGRGETPPLHNLLRAMTGVPLTVTVAKDGTVTGIDGVDRIREGVEAKPMAPTERGMIETATHLVPLPEAPTGLKVGGDWQTRLTWPHKLGSITNHVTHTLASTERPEGIPIANIHSEGETSLDVDPSQFPDKAPPIDVKLLRGEVVSDVIFDLQRREAVGRNRVRRQEIQVHIRLPNQTIERRIQQTTQGQVLRVAEGERE